MIDLHFDLLTKLYTSYLENDFTYIEEFCNYLSKNNVSGIIANMCFMSQEEMKEEYHEKYFDKNISVIEMFKVVKSLIYKYVNTDVDVIMSIEGCDYIDINDLEILYNLGLRAILPVWNEKNKYGSGNRSKDGLTLEGKKFLLKAFELGIGVDLSHANEKTFNDICELAKIAKTIKLNPIIYASHSNVFSLCDRDRNLKDDQLLKIKELDGLVGLFSHRNFIYKNSLQNKTDNELVKQKYLDHIIYLEKLFGGIDNIAVSTDDMTFCADKDPEYLECPIFNYKNIKNELEQLLEKRYSKEEIKKILYNNSKKLINKIKGENKYEFKRV